MSSEINYRLFRKTFRLNYTLYYKYKKSNDIKIIELIFSFLKGINYILRNLLSGVNLNLQELDGSILLTGSTGYQREKLEYLINRLNDNELDSKIHCLFPKIDDQSNHNFSSYSFLNNIDLLKIYYEWIKYLCLYLIKYKKNKININILVCVIKDYPIFLMNFYSALKVLDKIKPKLVMSIDPACQFTKSYEMIAYEKYKTNSLCAPFGFPSMFSKNFLANGNSYYATYSEKYKDIINSIIKNPQKTFITGDLFTKLNSKLMPNRNKIKIVTFISCPSFRDTIGKSDGQLSELQYYYFLEFICEFFTRKKDYQLIIRPHPADNNLNIINFFKEKFKIKIDSLTLDDSLDYSDIILGFYSTILFQSALHKKPYLLISWFGPNHFNLYKENYEYVSHNQYDFVRFFNNEIIYNGNNSFYDKELESHIKYTGNEAYEKLIKIIRQLA